MRIGFIGLGIMGSRMAANLQKHGYDLVVFNRTRAKAQPLIDKGATFAESPPKVAERVDVLFTMLAHPEAVEQAALGRSSGFLTHLKPNSLWVDCSSVNPSFSKKMAGEAAARQIRFIDAPVTGSAPAAAEAKLVFWVGADPADLERVHPLLMCMGNKIVHTGGHGMGTSMKMVVNLLLGAGMASFAEALALGRGLGLSQKMLFDSLLGAPAVAPFLALKREKIETGNYEAEFPLRWMQKDMQLATVSAYESGVAMPLANVTKEIYRLAMRDGHDTQDFSAIYDYLTNNHDVTTISQKSRPPALAQLRLAS
ncbi:MAG TPA: NAD(P)-dependent oxidoreductase [Chthoniobacterales bacterium]|jgi:3-hydroxyisobutyrate dehydrogenase/glyoxylate/succinic semialdehyde reductase